MAPDITVGYAPVASGSNSIVVESGGSVVSQAGSSGALNIGRLGNSDLAGTITISTIAFGAGSGRINFNQSDATTLSSAITGSGAVYQLGSGTTIHAAANASKGPTTVDAGTRLINGRRPPKSSR